METKTDRVWLGHNPWLRSVICNERPTYLEHTVKYISQAHFEEGEEKSIRPQVRSFTIASNRETLTQTIEVHVFYHFPNGRNDFLRTPGHHHEILQEGQALSGVLTRIRKEQAAVDAIVIKTRITSSRLNMILADTFDVIFPQGSGLDESQA